MTIFKSIIEEALARGYPVSVDLGEAEREPCKSYEEALDAASSVDLARVYIKTPERTEWLLYVHELGEAERVADLSADGFAEGIWDRLYDELYS